MRIDAKHPRFSHTRCWVDGEDVTDLCFEADETEGWARCYVRGPDGLVLLDGDNIKTETRRGMVRFRFD